MKYTLDQVKRAFGKGFRLRHQVKVGYILEHLSGEPVFMNAFNTMRGLSKKVAKEYAEQCYLLEVPKELL